MEQIELTPELIEKFQSGAVTEEDIVAAFNPANAATIPETILSLMEFLSPEQIAALAKAYPNKPTGNTYLVLKDSNLKTAQLYPRSTWENLFNLRRIGGAAGKAMVPFTFTARFNQLQQRQTIKTAPVQDLKKTELNSLPGITTGQTQKIGEATTGKGTEGANEGTGIQSQATTSDPGKTAVNANEGGTENFDELTVEEIKTLQSGKTESISDEVLISSLETKALEEKKGETNTGKGTASAKGIKPNPNNNK